MARTARSALQVTHCVNQLSTYLAIAFGLGVIVDATIVNFPCFLFVGPAIALVWAARRTLTRSAAENNTGWRSVTEAITLIMLCGIIVTPINQRHILKLLGEGGLRVVCTVEYAVGIYASVLVLICAWRYCGARTLRR